jgi:ethanolamine utilization cobalamin adenosyltransferase
MALMKPLTEQDIRMMFKKDESLRTLTVPKDTLVTPSAAEYLRAKRIALNYAEDGPGPAPEHRPSGEKADPGEKVPGPQKAASQGPETPRKVFYGPDGGRFDHKNESMTHLHGNRLVYKDHPAIIWRGKLDGLAALIIESQELGAEKGNQAFADDLQEILVFVRSLLPCEYKNIPVEPVRLLGLSSGEIRERSHNPLNYYGYPHILCDFRMGPLSVRLNRLRTAARETELAAATAFRSGNGTAAREDIIEALNRLSSIFYILMYKYLPKGFVPDSAGI